jgi:quinol monooxygenase YgiN
MKNVILTTLAVVFFNACASAQNLEQAHYFRIWQGYQKPEMSSQQLLAELPTFMKDTVDIYREKALNNYIVIIPPLAKPAYVPDELALVALNSKENYDLIRTTPEGQKYAARHWDIFNKDTSKSAPFINYASDKPSNLVSGTAYDLISNPIDWTRGYTAVFIGTKKSNLNSSDFLQKLQKHIESAQTIMQPKGLLGYIVIANENYEVAYLNWTSKEAHDNAAQTTDGKAVFAEAHSIMDVIMYTTAESATAGQNVEAGHAYSTLQR